jgi:hypothetical protein
VWKRLDVDKDRQYQVALCQEPDGARRYALVLAGAASLPEHCVFLTEVVPYDLLWWGDLEKIGRTVKLINGESFTTEAHGIWFTQHEADAWDRDEPWESIPWLNGLPPTNLPPC